MNDVAFFMMLVTGFCWLLVIVMHMTRLSEIRQAVEKTNALLGTMIEHEIMKIQPPQLKGMDCPHCKSGIQYRAGESGEPRTCGDCNRQVVLH